jgi:hypothetical protein
VLTRLRASLSAVQARSGRVMQVLSALTATGFSLNSRFFGKIGRTERQDVRWAYPTEPTTAGRLARLSRTGSRVRTREEFSAQAHILVRFDPEKPITLPVDLRLCGDMARVRLTSRRVGQRKSGPRNHARRVTRVSAGRTSIEERARKQRWMQPEQDGHATGRDRGGTHDIASGDSPDISASLSRKMS